MIKESIQIKDFIPFPANIPNKNPYYTLFRALDYNTVYPQVMTSTGVYDLEWGWTIAANQEFSFFWRAGDRVDDKHDMNVTITYYDISGGACGETISAQYGVCARKTDGTENMAWNVVADGTATTFTANNGKILTYEYTFLAANFESGDKCGMWFFSFEANCLIYIMGVEVTYLIKRRPV